MMSQDILQGKEKIVDFSGLGVDVKELLRKSVKQRELAYCPYSDFSVGAALLCEDGAIFTGCNVENAAYGLSLCAERTAIVKAVSEDNRSFKAIAVAAKPHGDAFTAPCGSCRQVLVEFAGCKDIEVYLTKPDLRKIMVTSALELLPHGFRPCQLVGT